MDKIQRIAEIEEHTKAIKAELAAGPPRLNPGIEELLLPYHAVHVKDMPKGDVTFAWYQAYPEGITDEKKSELKYMEHALSKSMARHYPKSAQFRLEFPIPRKEVSFLFAQQAYAKMRRSCRGNLIIIDTDFVINRYCDPFEADFDVALTDRRERWPLFPFNAGVMFLRDNKNARLFLDTMMEAGSDVPVNMASLYTEQLAMRYAYDQLKDKINIKVLPGRLWNYSPDKEEHTEANFVHLKGNRKAMIPYYLKQSMERPNARSEGPESGDAEDTVPGREATQVTELSY